MSTTETQHDACAMAPAAQREHEWLHRFVGDWQWEGQCDMGPDQPPFRTAGTERVRSIGGLWIVCEGESELPDGGLMTSIMTIGYDPQKKHFVGSFIASMMTHLWIYDHGALDDDQRVLTLHAEGPNMSPAATKPMAEYRDVIEMGSDEHRVLKSYMLGDDGQWTHFMETHYRRNGV